MLEEINIREAVNNRNNNSGGASKRGTKWTTSEDPRGLWFVNRIANRHKCSLACLDIRNYWNLTGFLSAHLDKEFHLFTSIQLFHCVF